MLFMEIGHFNNADLIPIYQRLRNRGRGLPEGLVYVDSWNEASFGRCFQLMECDDPAFLEELALEWRGLAAVEFVPVVP
ncbi:MAG: DUF3303 family protein [Thermomicrobiales bacterium]